MDYERLIERYARLREELSDQEQEEVERMLKSNPTAARLFQFFRAFYQEFEATGEAPSPEAELLAFRLGASERIIELHALPVQPDRAEPESPRLPSDSSAGQVPAVRHLTVLAAADHRALVRIVEDPYLRKVHLHVITDLPAERAGVVLRLYPLDLDVVTDQYGWAEIPITSSAMETWSNLSATRFLPIHRLSIPVARLHEGSISVFLPGRMGMPVSVSCEENELTMRIRELTSALCYVLLRSGSHSTLIRWEGTEVRARLAHLMDTIVISFY